MKNNKNANRSFVRILASNIIDLHAKIMFLIAPKYSVKHYYERKTGKKLDLDNPKTYNEKIQWTKLYDHNPKYTLLADKLKVRDYIKQKIGDQYLIPLLGYWKKFEDIDFEKLPNQFVLKCNHDCGSVIICKDKNTFDYKYARKSLTKALNNSLYYETGEWQYKDIEPYIIAEKYMIDNDSDDLRDYKFLCFNGEPVTCRVDFNRFDGHSRNIYDANWNLMPFQKGKFDNYYSPVPKPDKFDEMLDIARALSSGFRQVRVDLYLVNNKIYFGELTFTNATGIEPFFPDEYDLRFGGMWHLGEKNE